MSHWLFSSSSDVSDSPTSSDDSLNGCLHLSKAEKIYLRLVNSAQLIQLLKVHVKSLMGCLKPQRKRYNANKGPKHNLRGRAQTKKRSRLRIDKQPHAADVSAALERRMYMRTLVQASMLRNLLKDVKLALETGAKVTGSSKEKAAEEQQEMCTMTMMRENVCERTTCSVLGL